MDLSGKYIVIVGPAHPLRGGLATYDERLAKAFNDLGARTTILTFSLQYPNFLFPGKTQYSDDPAPEGLDIDVSLNSVNPFNWLSVGKKYKKRKPDLVVFRYWMPFMAPCLGTIARIIASNKHTRLVAITDNIIPHEKHFYDVPFTKYFLKPLHGFVTMSEAVLADLNQFDRVKPRKYTPHPMYDSFGYALEKEEAKRRLGLDGQHDYLLFFGFIRKYKGLDLLLQAFADERLRAFPLKLIIAGEYYEDAKPYHDLIQELKLEEHLIQKNDFIPNGEVPLYFSASDMVVQTYRDATQSGVTQVAYYYERPMLVTRVGGLAELVPHGKVGYVVEPEPKAISDAIYDFYTTDRAAEFAAHLPEEKKRFSWDTLIACLLEVSK